MEWGFCAGGAFGFADAYAGEIELGYELSLGFQQKKLLFFAAGLDLFCFI